jgi:hypothetical protein
MKTFIFTLLLLRCISGEDLSFYPEYLSEPSISDFLVGNLRICRGINVICNESNIIGNSSGHCLTVSKTALYCTTQMSFNDGSKLLLAGFDPAPIVIGGTGRFDGSGGSNLLFPFSEELGGEDAGFNHNLTAVTYKAEDSSSSIMQHIGICTLVVNTFAIFLLSSY